MGATTEVSVCFADLVGFTKLGEEIDPEQLGMVAARLEELASAVAEPPVRLVKTIGDAAMLVSTEAEEMTDAALRLVEAAEEESEEFPRLRAGIARGPVVVQTGDYYGRPVNLASRITAIAKPGSILADGATKQATPDAFEYSFAGERRLKGFDSRVKLYRVRRGEP
jgi:adenylate cyclase